MNILIESIGEKKLITLTGRLDSTNSAELETPVAKLVDEGCTKLIIDCSGMNYISSSGLRVFLVAQKMMKPVKGDFSICGLQPQIKDIFDMSGFSVIFRIYSNREEALLNLAV